MNWFSIFTIDARLEAHEKRLEEELSKIDNAVQGLQAFASKAEASNNVDAQVGDIRTKLKDLETWRLQEPTHLDRQALGFRDYLVSLLDTTLRYSWVGLGVLAAFIWIVQSMLSNTLDRVKEAKEEVNDRIKDLTNQEAIKQQIAGNFDEKIKLYMHRDLTLAQGFQTNAAFEHAKFMLAAQADGLTKAPGNSLPLMEVSDLSDELSQLAKQYMPDLINHSISSERENALMLIAKAVLCMAQGDIDEATELCSSAAQLDAELPEAQLFKGR